MKLRWSVASRRDLYRIADYIGRDSPRAAQAMVDRIEAATQILSQSPMAGRIGREASTRELAVPRSPYLAIYRVTTEVEVVRVVHGAQQWPPSEQ